MSNKNTELTQDKVWGLQDGESNGYVVLDANKVSIRSGGGEGMEMAMEMGTPIILSKKHRPYQG